MCLITILSFTACLENYQDTIGFLSRYYQDTIKLSERIVIFIKIANTKKQNNLEVSFCNV